MPTTSRYEQPELAAIDLIRIGHPLLLQAHEDLMQAIEVPAGRNVIFLFGPTGVGKTTLIQRVCEQLWDKYGPSHEAPGAFPALLINAPPTTAHGPAPVKWATQRALDAIGETGMGRRISLPLPPSQLLSASLLYDGRAPLPADFQALTKLMRCRGTKAFMSDEAQHYLALLRAARSKLQLDYFKLLADESGALVVLVGTYDLLVHRNLNGQLGRRGGDVHFRRYRANVDEEKEDFISFLHSLSEGMADLPESVRTTAPCLVDQFPLLYSRSVGCVGIVKDWVIASAAVARKSGRKQLRVADLKAVAPSIAKARRFLAEATSAEEILAAEDQGEEALLIDLGLLEAKVSRRGAAAEHETSGAAEGHRPGPSAPLASRRRTRSFHRKPKRDPVGEIADRVG